MSTLAPIKPIIDQLAGACTSFVQEKPTPTVLLAIVGALSIAGVTLSFLQLLAQLFIFPSTSLKKFGAKKGAWAVVTGATDGIGKEFALQLAKAGFNVYLASRTQEKLDAVAKEIESKYQVSTKTLAIDFSTRDEKAYNELATFAAANTVGVLVNNVGQSHTMPVNFVEDQSDEVQRIIDINVYANVRVTSLVAPSMASRKNGLILNLGSFAGMTPTPMLTTYSGSKAFLLTWSQALADELKPHGVVVRHVNTFFVVSNMSKIRRPSLLVPLPPTYVRSCLSHIDGPSVGRPYSTTPYWTHAIADWAISSVVGLLGLQFYIGMSNSFNAKTRVRALKKMERDAKRK